MSKIYPLYTGEFNGSVIELGEKGLKITSTELPNPVIIHVLFSKIQYITEITHTDNGNHFDIDCRTLNMPKKYQRINIHTFNESDVHEIYNVLIRKYADNISQKDKEIEL